MTATPEKILTIRVRTKRPGFLAGIARLFGHESGWQWVDITDSVTAINGRALEITADEWDKYEWIEIEPGVFIRGIEKTAPPNDGYHYVDMTTFSDEKQRWVRAKEYKRE